jgi:hypothetical protein
MSAGAADPQAMIKANANNTVMGISNWFFLILILPRSLIFLERLLSLKTQKGRVNRTLLVRPQVYVLNERSTWGLLNFRLDQPERNETLLNR